jgi:hypothetical protein
VTHLKSISEGLDIWALLLTLNAREPLGTITPAFFHTTASALDREVVDDATIPAL